jgi:predicted peroxiredoxin
VVQGSTVAVVELSKSIVAVKSPVTGTIVEVNPALEDRPDWVHRDPYGAGWIARLRLDDFATDQAQLLHGAAASEAMAEHARFASELIPATSGTQSPAMSFAEHSVAGVAILLWAADASVPERWPRRFHAAAAALDVPVEIYFSAASVRLLLPGVAAGLRASPEWTRPSPTTCARPALGAQLFACSDALHAQGIEAAQLMPGVQRGGAVQFMARAIDRDWRVLVF